MSTITAARATPPAIRCSVFFPCLLALLAALTGCPRQGGESSAPRIVPPETFSGTRGANQPAVQPDVRPYINRDDPLFGLPAAPRLPSDFTLGALYHEYEADARSREVYGLLTAFFDALNAGKPVDSYLHPDYRTFLLRSLKENPDLKSAIRGFRAGKFRFSGDMAQVEFLVFGIKGKVRSELVAEEKNSRWYISGLPADFADIFLPQAGAMPQEPFDPGSSGDSVF